MTTQNSNEERDLFLKIVRGEIPAHKVYEDDTTLAFLDIKPHNKGHVLVIPKAPCRNIFDIPEETLCNMMRVVKKLTPAVVAAVEADGVNIGMNNERAAGQEVFHAHMHIIPRFENDHVYTAPRHYEYKSNEIEQTAKDIRSHMN